MAEPPQPDDAVIFVGVSLVLGIASRHLLRGSRVPYTVALLVLGVVLGSLEYGTPSGLGKLGAGIRLWANINPDLLLSVFLPALLFESSFSMEFHQIKKCMMQMLLLAAPGVLLSTFFLGVGLKVAFPYNWDWKTSLLLGGLLSATDPVAVVALLKELGASKKLNTIIEGESLMNDGTAIVVYQLFLKMVLGQSFNAGDVIKFLSQVSLGAVAMGLAFGFFSVLWLRFIFNDTVIEIALTFAVSYIAFFTAQDVAEISGVLTVMTIGMFYAAAARTAFKGDGQQSLHHFWEMVAYIANTLIFVISGVVIAAGFLENDGFIGAHGTVWGYLILLYVFVQVSRLVVVVVLYPFLRKFGYGMDWKEAIILTWSGLRGAVALALSLSVKRASDADQFHITREVGILFVFFTGGIVFLTLIINGSSTQYLLHLLGMGKLSTEKIRILSYTKHEMLNRALESFGDLRDDEELGPADWLTVKRYITCLNNLGDEPARLGDVSPPAYHTNSLNLRDIRIRLLNGVQAAYWGMLEEGRVTQNVANILMRSVDGAMDVMSSQPLCDWKGLRSNVRFPNYYKFIQMSRLPRKLATYFTVERLETGCYICAAFLRAHRIARMQLHDFLGDSVVARAVIDESTSEGAEARKFLEDVRITFPQVLRVVKTRQVTYSVLMHLCEYVRNLQKVGLLEEKEMVHLDDALQTDLKKLLWNPPVVKMPKVIDLVNSHPLVGALPDAIREPLVASTKETVKLNGVTLYKEDSKANGIWLVSIGAVKWLSRKLSSKHSLHPVFSHGSTLGLYEVLTGKPCICDVVTDSVVHCFFIEEEKIKKLREYDAAIEDFLWRESVIVLAQILLPKLFEKMATHELRVFISENSEMKKYIKGENIEIGQHCVAILLEGFLNTQQGTTITPPGVLLPLQTDLNFLGLEPSAVDSLAYCHMSSNYHVGTRARMIFFDRQKVEMESTLQRSLSMLSHTGEVLRSSSKEHLSMLSWPENASKIGRNKSLSEMAHEPGNISARALHLSMFGSIVSEQRMSSSSRQLPSYTNSAHQISYSRVPSWPNQPSSSIPGQYEGPSTSRALPSAVAGPSVPAITRSKEDSSDDSDVEEVIVSVDSPSKLSFQQPLGGPVRRHDS